MFVFAIKSQPEYIRIRIRTLKLYLSHTARQPFNAQWIVTHSHNQDSEEEEKNWLLALKKISGKAALKYCELKD